MTELETSLRFLSSSFCTFHCISPLTPDSVKRDRVLILSLSYSSARLSASISPTSSKIELNALLVRGKHVPSGHGLSTSRHPDSAGMQNRRDRSAGLSTSMAEWFPK